MENNQYPLTFVDYNIIVPSSGVIIFDDELSPELLGVKNGDIFEVIVKDGKIMFRGIKRSKID